MRLMPSYHWSFPDVRAARTALAAGAVAGLVVIAACTDSASRAVTAPQSTRADVFPSGGFGQAKLLKACLDASLPAGTYTFRNVALNRSFVPDSYSNTLTGNGVYAGNFGGVDYWSDQGDGGSGTTVENADVGVDYTIAPGGCVDVLTRTSGDPNFMSHLSVSEGGPCDPADQSTWPDPGGCGGVNDSFAAANIQFISASNGYIFDKADCLVDEGALMPQHTLTPPPGPLTPGQPYPPWPSGGFNSLNPDFGNYGCGTGNNPTRAFVNYEHGTTITFFLKENPQLPCPAGFFTASLNGSGDLVMVFDQFPAPNDNSYGTNAVGWPNGHTFGNLTGSDKAGFQIKNASGTTVLDFNIDYLSAKSGTPSGYGSLGPFGGDGDLNVGTLTAADIIYTTSLAENLNSTGYCTAGNCSGLGTNLLVNSPPTDLATYNTGVAPAPYDQWNFHDTYFVTIKAAKLAALGLVGAPNQPGGWTAGPNLTALHNSPAKPCPAGPFPCADITVGAKSVKDKEVKADVNNTNASTDAFVTGVHLTWPTGTNGALKQIKIGGDVIWSGTNNSGNVNFVLADLVADANKRKIGKHSDEDVKFVFANNASHTLANYTASLDFGDTCNVPILP